MIKIFALSDSTYHGTSLGKECYTVINNHVDTPPKRAEKQARFALLIIFVPLCFYPPECMTDSYCTKWHLKHIVK